MADRQGEANDGRERRTRQGAHTVLIPSDEAGVLEESWRQVFIEIAGGAQRDLPERSQFPEDQPWIELPRVDDTVIDLVPSKMPALVGLRARVTDYRVFDDGEEEVVVTIDIFPNYPHLIRRVVESPGFRESISTIVTGAINLFDRGQVPVGASFHGWLGMGYINYDGSPRLTMRVWDFAVNGNPDNIQQTQGMRGLLKRLMQTPARGPVNPWWTSDSEAFSPVEATILMGLYGLLLHLWHNLSGMPGVKNQLLKQVSTPLEDGGVIKLVTGRPPRRPWRGPDLFP